MYYYVLLAMLSSSILMYGMEKIPDLKNCKIAIQTDEGSIELSSEQLAQLNITLDNIVTESEKQVKWTPKQFAIIAKKVNPDLGSLLEAMVKGNFATIKRILDAGLDINAKEPLLGLTPLMVAALDGNVTAVNYLLERGANSSLKNKDRATAIELAASEGHSLIVGLLVEHSDDKQSAKNRALIAASFEGHLALANLLIEQGADVNARDEETQATPLIRAADSGHRTLVKILLSKGAKIDAVDNVGWSPLMLAAQNGHLDVVKILIETIKDLEEQNQYVDMQNKNGDTALMIAAQRGNTKIVKVLLRYNSSLTLRCNEGHNAFMHAFRSRHIELVKLLVPKHDSTPEEMSLITPGETAALLRGEEKRGKHLYEILLKNSEEITIDTERSSDTSVAASIRVNIKNEKLGPLGDYLSLFMGLPAELEISFDKEETQVNNKACKICNKTPTKKCQRCMSICYCSQNCQKVDWSKHKGACMKKYLIDQAMAHDSNLNEPINQQGQTVLMLAAKNGYTELVTVLLKKKANILIMDKSGKTALSLAQENAHDEIVKLLIKAQARIKK